MRMEYPGYGLPVDTRPGRPKLRHRMDYESMRDIMHKIQNKNAGNLENG